ncbi:hypothetical protein BYT27DRAFT_7180846 [Phlegmacium glaucopus]|nr:hypothetical protein BYT27DRAFT_7180846 [Phlegmacium glaucopus]
MAPFTSPKVVISGLKEKFDSLLVHADRLYLGSSTGNLYIYSLNEVDGGERTVELVEVKKNLVRRSIEQLGLIKNVNSLVVLSEATVTLFSLPSVSPPTPLIKAKAAFSFAIHSCLQPVQLDPQQWGDPELNKSQAIPTLVTQLLVGCRRKVVLYSWKDGEPQEVKEAPLPHSARVIVFLNKDTACFAYSPTEYAIFSIPTMSAMEIVTPLPITGSGTAMNALTGLTGYMTLGLGAKAKPTVVQVGDSEILVGKDGEGLFIGTDGKPSRPATIEWPAPPEEIAFVKPYIFSILPAGTVPTQSLETSPTPGTHVQPSFNSTTVLQVRSSLSLQISQTIPFPFNHAETNATQNANVRLMTSSSSVKCPLYMMTTPIDKTAALNEGSSIWCFSMRPWSEQIDELVIVGQYSDALALLETVDGALLPEKDQRRTQIRALNAVAQFRAGKFDAAIDTFIELDFNPAKVVALYSESVAGRLSVPQEGWIPLYGGPSLVEEDNPSPEGSQENDKAASNQEKPTADLENLVSATGSIGGRFRRTGLGLFMPSVNKDSDSASVKARRKPLQDDLRRSVETLVRYLADRRPKLGAALEVVNITPESQSHLASPLSEASTEELFALPNVPLSALTPEQLLRFAQVVDTALYKSYLIIRPALLGSLCRVANWCEVSEVEEDLRVRKKYAELRDLYHGKKMHARALELLKELSETETDMDDKLDPSIRYLQKLGPEHIDQIFTSSSWIFNHDPDRAFQIFTSEDVELPKQRVADYLESIDAKLCARYLEYIINERDKDAPATLHTRLAELYLSMVLSAKKRNEEKARKETYEKLLGFISLNDCFSIDRLYGLLSSTDLYEARAILLGRLGRHDQALETYVYRLQDYVKAEEHCKRVYRAGSGTSGIFLALLKLYLRPTSQTSSDLLRPALELISRHGPRLDAVETLQLLPPLVTADDIRPFLIESLRTPVFDTRVTREISKARNDQLSRRLMALQSRRVKVTDSRICPHCHKRLGNSVIAVHAPRGEVTHYQCREPFSRHLQEYRR